MQLQIVIWIVKTAKRNVVKMSLAYQKRKYISKSHCCLNCGSSDIEGGSIQVDAGGAIQDISCTVCGSTWTDLYKLDDVVNIEISNDHKEVPDGTNKDMVAGPE
jgi:transcription elongation factor Elf1